MDYDKAIVCGDFNTDLRRNNPQSRSLQDFMQRNSLTSVLNGMLTNTDESCVTFISNNGFSSHIDHFLLSVDCLSSVKSVDILDYASYSKEKGHFPICLEFCIGQVDSLSNPNEQLYITNCKSPRIAWHRVHSFTSYRETVNTLLHQLCFIDGLSCLSCKDCYCRENEHLEEIDFLCKTLTDICIEAANTTLPKVRNKKALPNWNEVKPLKSDVTFWGYVWRQNGRPNSGAVYNIYKHCRHKYHYAIRGLKKKEKELRLAKLAESVAQNDSRNIWKELRKIKGNSKVSPPNIDGKTSNKDINNLFAEKYKKLFNSTPTDITKISQCVYENVAGDVTDDYEFSQDIVSKAVKRIKSEKSDGDKGFMSTLLIETTDLWKSYFSKLVSAMLYHGQYPSELLISTITSLPKNEQGNLCDSDNYRGITLNSCLTKAIDWMILIKYEFCFKTSDLQFAYKPKHSTVMCSLAMKEVVRHYHNHKGEVYAVLIDASKAFDRVHFDKIFEILQQKNLPNCVIRLLIDMYLRQEVRTSWQGAKSEPFFTSNGVRQGGVLSPVLFTLYMDILLKRLEDSGIGCMVGSEYFGGLCYADDVTVLAPNLSALQKMLITCEQFGLQYGVTFNAKKTECINLKSRMSQHPYPNVKFCGQMLQCKTVVKHLGNYVSADLKEDKEINKKWKYFIYICHFGVYSSKT